MGLCLCLRIIYGIYNICTVRLQAQLERVLKSVQGSKSWKVKPRCVQVLNEANESAWGPSASKRSCGKQTTQQRYDRRVARESLWPSLLGRLSVEKDVEWHCLTVPHETHGISLSEIWQLFLLLAIFIRHWLWGFDPMRDMSNYPGYVSMDIGCELWRWQFIY